jgi:hypothetical protein
MRRGRRSGTPDELSGRGDGIGRHQGQSKFSIVDLVIVDLNLAINRPSTMTRLKIN